MYGSRRWRGFNRRKGQRRDGEWPQYGRILDIIALRIAKLCGQVAIMKRLRHPNIVLFNRTPNLSIVIEYLSRFYTECFGMKLLRKRDILEEKYSNAFLRFSPEEFHFVLELTYNYGFDNCDIGTGFRHFAIATEDRVSGGIIILAPEGTNISVCETRNSIEEVLAFIQSDKRLKN